MAAKACREENMSLQKSIKINEKEDREIPTSVLFFDNDFLSKMIEAYRVTNLKWVENMIDELYSDTDNYEDICSKYNVKLYSESVHLKGGLLIYRADYDMDEKCFIVTLSQDGVDAIDNNEKKKDLITEMESILTHEDTHSQQDKGKNREQKYISPVQGDEKSKKDYLYQQVEVDAYARSIAYELKEKNYSVQEIFDALVSGNKDILSSLSEGNRSALEIYRDNRDKNFTEKTWRRFLRQVYLYLCYDNFSESTPYYRYLKLNENGYI